MEDSSFVSCRIFNYSLKSNFSCKLELSKFIKVKFCESIVNIDDNILFPFFLEMLEMSRSIVVLLWKILFLYHVEYSTIHVDNLTGRVKLLFLFIYIFTKN